MLRRFLSGVFSLAFLLSIIPQLKVSASTNPPSTDNVFYCDTTKTTHLTVTESLEYECYEACMSANVSQNQTAQYVTAKSELLAYCDLSSSHFSGDTLISIYTSDTIAEFLHNCATVNEISIINNYLYISYTTNDGVEVTLCYDNSGLHDKVIYFPESDTAIINNSISTTKVEGFRTGCSYEASEEQIRSAYATLPPSPSPIDSSAANLNNLVTAPPASNEILPLATGFSNEESMLTDLRITFPPQDGQVIFADSLYSEYLKDNFSVCVRQTRNAYVKKSADYRSFAISTALSVISTYLGVSVSVASAIVTGLGIVISATNTILQAATLYRSAVYRFFAARDGYVYDKITQNSYVHVVYYSSYGEFTGGYASNGSFTWVISGYPNAYEQDATSIANQALRLYGMEVFANGYNSLYYPD